MTIYMKDRLPERLSLARLDVDRFAVPCHRRRYDSISYGSGISSILFRLDQNLFFILTALF
jgi:hypothetical protein